MPAREEKNLPTITVNAETEQLDNVISFLDTELENAGCPMKVQLQLELVTEEIFVNIASYAYAPDSGKAEISIDISGNPAVAVLCFKDSGTPYNPLVRPEADTSLSLEERGIGGLGILLIKKNSDDVCYSYENGKNVLTVYKKIREEER
jgi:anti-sigma regulatory factor (Ser/Thr protein kinase)